MNEDNAKNRVHLIGNAHIDPVWLWRYEEGFAEIKATFRSALDRIADFPNFVFTCACASYYEWVEQNCPEMFDEIKKAVAKGQWKIVGGMWIQPDVNIPSAESFMRHFLYSKNYFIDKFGIEVLTGYNVDSFGHSSTLPRLLNAAGMKNYVFLRPSNGNEKSYDFDSHTFRWKCGESEVMAFRIYGAYGYDLQDDETCRDLLKEFDEYASMQTAPMMFFYGVGNHGGAPTIQNIEILDAFKGKNNYQFSDPDTYFDDIRENKCEIPTYEGDLQNHASGCYSANHTIKMLNRKAENRLVNAEKLSVMSANILREFSEIPKFDDVWKKVLFNQFHDILCGCSIRSAYDDAYAEMNAAIAFANRTGNAAVQKISWAIDTSKGLERNHFTKKWGSVWDGDELGGPVVVFNPLSHGVRIPVDVHRPSCIRVEDENGRRYPCQMVRGEHTNGEKDQFVTRFIAEVPAFGYKTFWCYSVGEKDETDTGLKVRKNVIENGIVRVEFDGKTGEIVSYTVNGQNILGAKGTRVVAIDDHENDTWAHNQFVFDKVIGTFGNAKISIVENGPAEVAIRVQKTWKNNKIDSVYSLHPGEECLSVRTRIFMEDPEVIVKFIFDTGIENAEFIREQPGGMMHEILPNGREKPMQRYMIMGKDGCGIAILNDSKYSASAVGSECAFVAVRTCYFADHYGVRDDRMIAQDTGWTEFHWAICPYSGNIGKIADAAEELNTYFLAIPETFHKGSLPQAGSFYACDCENVALIAVKAAEDRDGLIFRFAETAGRACKFNAKVFNSEIEGEIEAFGIRTYRDRNYFLHKGMRLIDCDSYPDGIMPIIESTAVEENEFFVNYLHDDKV